MATLSETKHKLNPLYKELQGYLAQCPLAKDAYYQYNSFYWTQLDSCIEQINTITGEDYSRFKIAVIRDQDGDHIDTNEYRAKLNGLIMSLKGNYFSEEADPFGGSPLVSVSQSQNVQVTMLLEINTLIDKALFSEEAKNLKPEEKTFLEKVKAALPNIKTAAELLVVLIRLAKESGIDIHTLSKLFG